jgi:GDYXXLXY protein
MRPDVLAVAAALALQAALVAAIPLHETFVRTTGRTVVIAVEPIDPYDPVRGYHADFKYRGLGPTDPVLPGFDHQAADGSPAFVLLQPDRGGAGARPIRIVRSPADGRGALVIRAHYVVRGDCSHVADDSSCRFLHVTPDAWYADEGAFNVMGGYLRENQAVAELRVTADGDASLIRLRPSPAAQGPGEAPILQLRPSRAEGGPGG